MILVEILRYTRGWVRFEAVGNFPERFLNLAARETIATWGTQRLDKGGLSSCTAASNYRKLRSIAKKTGVRLHITERGGFPFVRNRYRRRTGLLVGAAVFVLFICIMSNFVWRIDVSGNKKLDSAVIIKELSDLGVREGTSRTKIDARDVERKMLLKLPDLGWIAVNIRGGVAEIRIHERTLPPKILDSKTPCNLVATDAGQIKRMEVYEGQAEVKVGDTVIEGDVVISGMVGKDGAVSRLAHASGNVMAEVPVSLKVNVPFKQETIKIIDVKKRFAFSIFGIELPLYIATPVPKPYKLEKIVNELNIMGFKLPFGLVKLNYLIGEENEITLDPQQALNKAEKQLANLEISTFGKSEITFREPKSSKKEASVQLECNYRVIKNIVNEIEILTN